MAGGWKRIDPTETHKVGWRTVVTKSFVMPDGGKTTFDTFGPENQHHAAIIGLTPEKQVIVVSLFRTGPELMMDELPGGMVDPHEDIQAAAVREFTEETGYQPGAVESLGAHHKDAYMNATWHYFLATDCVRTGEQKLEAEEHIELKLIGIDQLIANAKQDRMTDAVAVLMALDRLQELGMASSDLPASRG